MAALSPPIFDTLIKITSELDFSFSFDGKEAWINIQEGKS